MKNIHKILLLCFIITALIVATIHTDIALNNLSNTNINTTISSNTGNTDTCTSIAKGLYAKYACLIDAETGRVLIGKNAYTKAPMASTTKIMTLIIALEYGDASYTSTTSAYAASMPDVQLNAKKGQQFKLEDLYYSLMLQSHNDSAVIIAENVALQYISHVRNNEIIDEIKLWTISNFDFVPHDISDSSFLSTITKEQSKQLVSVFTALMNYKALSLGCTDTHFITPNGLDAGEGDNIHSTTPRDLCLIMAYCIKNETFLKITQTRAYSFDKYSISNANKFLNMYPGIISGKTGFTNDAGYCYVCAYKDEEKTFIVSLLGCGWPNNKTYKWKDSKKMLNYAREAYFDINIIKKNTLNLSIPVNNGDKEYTTLTNSIEYSMLLSENDSVEINLNLPCEIDAPVYNGQTMGYIDIYINNELHKSIPVYADDNINAIDKYFKIKSFIKKIIFIDK